MDVSSQRSPVSLLALAALALVILGAALSALTWRNLVEQRRLIDQHVLFAARAILHGVEANLTRVMPMLGRMQPEEARQRLQEAFHEVTASGDVLFLGVYDSQGQLLLSSQPDASDGHGQPPLDPMALEDLAVTGEWFGSLPFAGGTTMLGYASVMRPGMAQFCPGGRGSGQGSGQGPGPGQGPGRVPGQGMSPGRQSPVYFLVGMSLDEHYQQYRQFRSQAVAQTGFVLGAAALVWLLLVAYMRRRTQGRRLVRLESFHSKLLDSIPEGIMAVDASGMVTAANPAAKNILGEDLAGRSFDSLPVAACLREPGEGCAPAGEWRQQDLDGRHLEILSRSLDGETLVILRDRTHLRSLENDLEQSRQLATVGRLAAGVAHEIRNPLSALRGFAQLFASKLKGREPEESYARTMVQEADRLGRVVTDLLYLAKPRPMEPAPVELAALCGELESLLRFDLERRSATFATALEAPEALADPDALKQALINLVLNALAALPAGGGSVTVRSRARPGGTAVSVEDNGHGMSEEERARALEPFFTTRRDGSGLGLAIVQSIVRHHGGELEIESDPGRGTRVTMFFRSAAPPGNG
ncbi:two-component system sensor histidine kinase NtrB [Fundidesulfovibrio agrisoli]|uniref:two-component system sensor histidine kinase NtrB n=1 Tax=Fundidesulfovibrio agrisoli TaxID=2922717 RepID=UPI001FABD3E1